MTITKDDVRAIIQHHADNKPRSRQTQVGISALGTACGRKLAHHIAGTPKVNDSDPLPAWVGTGGHAQMEEALADNPDWETEIRVVLPGYGMPGTADAYHRPSRTVIDWKFGGPSAMKRAKAGNVSDQYRVQVHAYGLGLRMAGYLVEQVAIGFIPRAGMLHQIIVWSEPMNEDVVEAALRRYEALGTLATPATIGLIPTAEDFCSFCPFHNPFELDPAKGCRGHIDDPGTPGAIQPNPTRQGIA
jgi:hypothetical protein